MFGRVPGGSGKRPAGWALSGRAGMTPTDWSASGAGPERNSTIQSAVSARTSSVTSSEKRRSTPRQRSAASLAVPSVGPEDLPDALRGPVELQGLETPLHGLCRRHVPHPAGRQSEVPVAGQTGGAEQQREITPADGALRHAGQVQQRERGTGDHPDGRADPQDPGAAALPDAVGEVPLGGAQGMGLHPAVQLVEPFRGLAPVTQGERRTGQIAVDVSPGAPVAASPAAGSPGDSSVQLSAHVLL